MDGGFLTQDEPVGYCIVLVFMFRVWQNRKFLHSKRDCEISKEYATTIWLDIGGTELGFADDQFFGVRIVLVLYM